MPVRRFGITAVEVMVSTLLASLLMVAMLGVLRGLKMQAEAVDTRLPAKAWQRTLDGVLQQDLENSRTYELTETSLLLHGYASRNAVTGSATWQRSSIVYKIVSNENQSWLVRRELNSESRELVLKGVTALRVGMLSEDKKVIPPAAGLPKSPILDGLAIEFWGSNQKGPIYAYRFRRP